MEVYIGMVFLFAGNFAPVGFALCQGQLLAINTNTALFSILGTSYGGDGVRTFGLPNLQGRMAIGAGQGQGLSPYVIGATGGRESITLLTQNMPQHNHLLMGDGVGNGKEFPGPNHVIGASPTDKMYSANAPTTNMNIQSISQAGGSQPFASLPPYLALNYIIATTGLFPSRN